MDNGIKIVLQIDPLAQAVGADEDPFIGLPELCDPLFAFRRRQGAGNRHYLY